MSLLPFIHRVSEGASLSMQEARDAMGALLDGTASESQVAAFLVALRMKGETAAELAGFAGAMRERMIVVDAGENVIDTCGTGGDGVGTFNISTVAAFVMAGAGARIAKHGNRSISSRSGSADVFEALGVRAAMTAEEAGRAVREIGIGFLYAPGLHPAMKFVQPVRRELKMRTVFNLLGPLANPARARSQVIGAPSTEAASLMAEALAHLGTGRVFVVHGSGLDEVSIAGPTDVFEVCGSRVMKHRWTPEDFGLQSARIEALAGGVAAHNAQIARDILSGKLGPGRDVVLMNAVAGLVAGGLFTDLREAMSAAAQSIDTGAALRRLTELQKHFPVKM